MDPIYIPFEISDPVNARILAVAEDKLHGFQREPLREIARLLQSTHRHPRHFAQFADGPRRALILNRVVPRPEAPGTVWCRMGGTGGWRAAFKW